MVRDCAKVTTGSNAVAKGKVVGGKTFPDGTQQVRLAVFTILTLIQPVDQDGVSKSCDAQFCAFSKVLHRTHQETVYLRAQRSLENDWTLGDRCTYMVLEVRIV